MINLACSREIHILVSRTILSAVTFDALRQSTTARLRWWILVTTVTVDFPLSLDFHLHKLSPGLFIVEQELHSFAYCFEFSFVFICSG